MHGMCGLRFLFLFDGEGKSDPLGFKILSTHGQRREK
jgi:hypothetical protein